MQTPDFVSSLRAILARKSHRTEQALASGRAPRELLTWLFEQEFIVWVRDTAIFLGRAYVECPTAATRAALAAMIYEAETGALVLGEPHQTRWLATAAALAIPPGRFQSVTPLHESARLRAYLDEATMEEGWEVALVIASIFTIDTGLGRGVKSPQMHPLALHYGLATADAAAALALCEVRSAHLAKAWTLAATLPEESHARVLAAAEEALDRWLDYREALARACGMSPPSVPAV